MSLNDITWLRPQLLWLAVLVAPILWFSAFRLGALGPLRRRAAVVLQTLSAFLIVAALAEPALARPNNRLDLVLVMDASSSVSDASRGQAVDYAKGVLSSAGPSDRVRFVAVGQGASLISPDDVRSGAWASPGDSKALPGASATDLAAGLRLAGGLLGDSGPRRVVVLTDGWETRGDAAGEASALTARGVDLRVVALSALGDREVVLESLSSVPYARVGDRIAGDATIYSTTETSATLRISVDGADPVERRVSLSKGENLVPVEQKAEAEGFHHMEVTVSAPADARPGNNTARSTVMVKPQPRVLVLEERLGEASEIAAALETHQMSVEVRVPAAIPPEAGGLDQYDAVVLNNIAATSCTLDQQRTLQEYARRYGRGLVVTGGRTSFARGGYADSVLEQVLPVSSQPPPRPQEGATGLLLVMDRSASMDDHIDFEGKVTKFDMSKQAASLAVESLRDGDTVGVLMFDTQNLWVVPVTTLHGKEDKDRIKGMIEMSSTGGGTAIYPAVDEAAQAMRTIAAPNRHVVLLTDGLDNGNMRYEPIINSLRMQGASLSTIGIGSDADKDLLTMLAKAGQGRYYFTEQPENLPRIVFKELELALRQAVLEGQVQPHVAAPSPLLHGIAPQDIPLLGGYDLTTPKSDAVVGLISDRGDPLLAHWNYGLGRVVAFASDTGSAWAQEWVQWPGYQDFWSQAVRWSMASPVNRQLQPSITVEDATGAGRRTAHLVVESLNADNTFADLADVEASLRAPSGKVTSVTLGQTAPGRYEGSVELTEPGAYEAIFTRTGNNISQTAESAAFSTPPDEELLHAGANDRLLQRLAGGRDYITKPEQALEREGLSGAAVTVEELWPYALAPALLFLLLSVAVRRLDFRRTASTRARPA